VQIAVLPASILDSPSALSVAFVKNTGAEDLPERPLR